MMKPVPVRIKNEDGIALVITLLVMTILLIMGSAFMSISSTETLIAINERNRVQAYHLAEAGAERAIAQLNVNAGYTGTGGEQPLGLGTYSATVCPPTCVPPAVAPANPNQRLINATGCIRNCAMPVRATAQVEVLVARTVFGLGAFGRDEVRLDSSSRTDSYNSDVGPYEGAAARANGHVGSNGDIRLTSGSQVKGAATAGGIVTLDSGTSVTGTVTEAAPALPFDPVDATYKNPNDNESIIGLGPNATYDEGNHTLRVINGATVTLPSGTYYFSRVELESGRIIIAGPVTMYLTGKFELDSGAAVNEGGLPSNLLIYSSFSSSGPGGYALELESGSRLSGVVHAPEGRIRIDSNSDLFGSAVGSVVRLTSGSRFHYDEALGTAGSGGRFRPVAGTWREVFAP